MDEHATETLAEVGQVEPHEKQGLPQLDPASFSSQLFWLTLTFVILYMLMARAIVPRIHEVLEKRANRIAQDINRAEELSGEAAEAKRDFEKLEVDTRAQAASVMAQARQLVKSMETARYVELDAELATRLAAARQSIAARVGEARAGLEPAVRDVAVALVEKLAAAKPDIQQLDAAVAGVRKDG